MKPPLTGWQRPAALKPTPNSNNRGLRVTKFQNWYQSPYFWHNPVTSSKFGGEEYGVDGSNRNGDQERNRKLPPPNGPRSQLPPSLEFPSPNLEESFPAAICPEWDSGDI